MSRTNMTCIGGLSSTEIRHQCADRIKAFWKAYQFRKSFISAWNIKQVRVHVCLMLISMFIMPGSPSFLLARYLLITFPDDWSYLYLCL